VIIRSLILIGTAILYLGEVGGGGAFDTERSHVHLEQHTTIHRPI